MSSTLADLRNLHWGDFDTINRHVLQQTTALLGATISYTSQDWASESSIPEWTRAQVAAHLVQGARLIQTIATQLKEDLPIGPLPDENYRHDELELLSACNPLDLQIALDTSAQSATEMLSELPEAMYIHEVLLPCVMTTAANLPLARLAEVVIHRLDMRDGFTLNDIDDETVMDCLVWRANLLVGQRDFPATRIVAEEGLDLTIGRPGAPTVAAADSRTLLLWITGRGSGPSDRFWQQLPLS